MSCRKLDGQRNGHSTANPPRIHPQGENGQKACTMTSSPQAAGLSKEKNALKKEDLRETSSGVPHVARTSCVKRPHATIDTEHTSNAKSINVTNGFEKSNGVADRKKDNERSSDPGEDDNDASLDVEFDGQPWPVEIHRKLVEAIYEVGVTHASPSLIMEQMTMIPGDGRSEEARHLNSEHLKSHLQKYRKNKEKSKEEFMQEYDRWLQKAANMEAVARSNLSPSGIAKMMGDKTLLGGDMAAYLTYSVMAEQNSNKSNREAANESGSTARASLPSAMEYAHLLSGAVIPCPNMTEEERNSSVGISLSHVIGLFYSVTRSLMAERNQTAATPVLMSDYSDDQDDKHHRQRAQRKMPPKRLTAQRQLDDSEQPKKQKMKSKQHQKLPTFSGKKKHEC